MKRKRNDNTSYSSTQDSDEEIESPRRSQKKVRTNRWEYTFVDSDHDEENDRPVESTHQTAQQPMQQQQQPLPSGDNQMMQSIRSRLHDLFMAANAGNHTQSTNRLSPGTPKTYSPPPPPQRLPLRPPPPDKSPQHIKKKVEKSKPVEKSMEKKKKKEMDDDDDDIIEVDHPDDSKGDMCIICQEPLSIEGNHRAAALRCGHVFGLSCINTWFCSNTTCPICKEPMPDRMVIPLFLQESMGQLFTSHVDKKLEERAAKERSRVRAVKRDLRAIQKTLNTVKQWVKPFASSSTGEPTMSPELLMKSIYKELQSLPTHRFLPTKDTEVKNPLSNNLIKLKTLYQYATQAPPTKFDFLESFHTIVFCQTQFGHITLFDLREGQTLLSTAIGPRNSFEVHHIQYHRPFSMVLVLTNTGQVHGLTFCKNKLSITGCIALPPSVNMTTFAADRHYVVLGGMNELLVYDLCFIDNSPTPVARVPFHENDVHCVAIAFDKHHNGVMLTSNHQLYVFTIENLLATTESLQKCTPSHFANQTFSPLLHYNPHTNQFCLHTTMNNKQSYHLCRATQLQDDQPGTIIPLPNIPSYLSRSHHIASMKHSLYLSINHMHLDAQHDVVSLDDVHEEMASYVLYPFKNHLFIYECATSSWISKYPLKSPLTTMRLYTQDLTGAYLGHLHENGFVLDLFSS